jgi:hypothetical protein
MTDAFVERCHVLQTIVFPTIRMYDTFDVRSLASLAEVFFVIRKPLCHALACVLKTRAKSGNDSMTARVHSEFNITLAIAFCTANGMPETAEYLTPSMTLHYTNSILAKSFITFEYACQAGRIQPATAVWDSVAPQLSYAPLMWCYEAAVDSGNLDMVWWLINVLSKHCDRDWWKMQTHIWRGIGRDSEDAYRHWLASWALKTNNVDDFQEWVHLGVSKYAHVNAHIQRSDDSVGNVLINACKIGKASSALALLKNIPPGDAIQIYISSNWLDISDCINQAVDHRDVDALKVLHQCGAFTLDGIRYMHGIWSKITNLMYDHIGRTVSDNRALWLATKLSKYVNLVDVISIAEDRINVIAHCCVTNAMRLMVYLVGAMDITKADVESTIQYITEHTFVLDPETPNFDTATLDWLVARYNIQTTPTIDICNIRVIKEQI